MTKTSALPAASSLSGGELVPIVQAGTNKTAAAGTLLAKVNSQTFTGIPAAPTAAVGTDTTQVATTAFANASAAAASTALKAELANDEEDVTDVSGPPGTSLIGYFNEALAKFGAAVQLQAILDWIWTNGLWAGNAQDPTSVGNLAAGDQVAVFGADGTMKAIDHEFFLGGGSEGVIDFNFAEHGSNWDVTAADAGKTIVSSHASPATITLQLQSVAEWVPGRFFDYIENGAGAVTTVCDDPSIVVNGAADGVVASPGRYGTVRVRNLAPNVWNATGNAVSDTADTTNPTIVSISPTPGSTIAIGTDIEVTFDEAIAAGSGNITQRQSVAMAAFTDDGTLAIGSATIVGNKLTIPASGFTARDAGNRYAYQIAASCIDDTADTPNSFAGVADDATIGPFTVAASAPSEITVVDAEGFDLNSGPTGGGTQTKTLRTTPATGDMVLVFQANRDPIPGGAPDDCTYITASSFATGTPSSPACLAAYRIEGGSPSNQVTFKTVYFRKSAAAVMILRGGGGTLAPSGDSGVVSQASASGPVDAPAYSQVVANELRYAVGWVKNEDLTATVTALEAAGWVSRVIQTTAQGSASVGATVLLATKAQGGSISDSVNPPAWGTTNCIMRALQGGIKET